MKTIAVPVEPTEKMREAAWNKYLEIDKRFVSWRDTLCSVYQVMLEAAPPQSEPANTRAVPVETFGARPILYTDSINGEQVCRDDLWLITTAQLRAAAPEQPEPTDHLAAPDSRERAKNAAATQEQRTAGAGVDSASPASAAAPDDPMRRISFGDRRQNAAVESPAAAAPSSTLPLLGTYAWAQGVVDAEGYAGWMVIGCSSGGGLCLHESKRILVDELHDQNPFMFLHEIAHIRHVGHGAHWADYFTRLCLQYVGPVINERDAQAALAQVQLDRAEFAALKAKLALAKEAIRATAGLQRIAETERDQYKDKLAKYERAKMPPEPERLTMTRKLTAGGVATETVVAAHKYDELRTFAASQTVRSGAAVSNQCQMHAEHCWHDTGYVLTCNPPIYIDICCWCGETKQRQMFSVYDNTHHGKYMPGQYSTVQAPAPKP